MHGSRFVDVRSRAPGAAALAVCALALLCGARPAPAQVAIIGATVSPTETDSGLPATLVVTHQAAPGASGFITFLSSNPALVPPPSPRSVTGTGFINVVLPTIPSLVGGQVTITAVGDLGSAGAMLTLRPANNTCSRRWTIQCGQTLTGATTLAEAETQPLCDTGDGTAGAVWFTVTGTGTWMRASTCSMNTDFATTVRIYDGSCGALVCIAGNNFDTRCDSGSFRGAVVWPSSAGTDYIILVHGSQAASGDFELAVDCDVSGACCVGTSCSIMLESECAVAGGQFQGAGSTCEPYAASPADPAVLDFDAVFEFALVDDCLAVETVEVRVDLSVTRVGDVTVTLTAPDGTSVDLMHRPGFPFLPNGSLASLNGSYVFTDDAALTVADVAATLPPFLSVPIPPGEFRAAGPGNARVNLNATFAGISTRGDWVVSVGDQEDLFGGATSFFEWALLINGRTICSPTLPGCPCERDGVSGINVFDLLAYLDHWFSGALCADIDGVPGVDVFDLLAFLDCWFAASAGQPCP